MNHKKINKMKTIMEKYILTIIFMMFGISVNAKDAYYAMRDDASDQGAG